MAKVSRSHLTTGILVSDKEAKSSISTLLFSFSLGEPAVNLAGLSRSTDSSLLSSSLRWSCIVWSKKVTCLKKGTQYTCEGGNQSHYTCSYGYICKSSGQDEVNLVFSLATWAGKIGPSCIGPTRKKFYFWHNKSFNEQAWVQDGCPDIP